MLSELGGCHRHWNAAQVCEPLPDLGICEAGVDLPLSLLTISAGVFFRRADPEPCIASQPGTNSATAGMSGSTS